eukprot:3589247-Prymnesium_polylepis.3
MAPPYPTAEHPAMSQSSIESLLAAMTMNAPPSHPEWQPRTMQASRSAAQPSPISIQAPLNAL